MKSIIQTYQTIKYSYKPGEFLPVYSGGELLNKSDFIRYKAKCLLLKRSLV